MGHSVHSKNVAQSFFSDFCQVEIVGKELQTAAHHSHGARAFCANNMQVREKNGVMLFK